MTKKAALTFIKAEVATYGIITALATRCYVENRISKEAFNRAVKIGWEIFNLNKKNTLIYD